MLLGVLVTKVAVFGEQSTAPANPEAVVEPAAKDQTSEAMMRMFAERGRAFMETNRTIVDIIAAQQDVAEFVESNEQLIDMYFKQSLVLGTGVESFYQTIQNPTLEDTELRFRFSDEFFAYLGEVQNQYEFLGYRAHAAADSVMSRKVVEGFGLPLPDPRLRGALAVAFAQLGNAPDGAARRR